MAKQMPQELAKEMEEKFLSDLQERLDEVKQNPLPYKYQHAGIVVAKVYAKQRPKILNHRR